MTEEELRARLLAEAEAVINDLLANKPVGSQITLSDIERLTVRTGQQIQANVLKELVRANEEVQGAEAPRCEQCGRRMQRRGTRPRQVITEAGEMTVARAYYVCPRCGASLFPPG